MRLDFDYFTLEIKTKNDIKKIVSMFKEERDWAIYINQIMYNNQYYFMREFDALIDILIEVLNKYKRDRFSEEILQDIEKSIVNDSRYRDIRYYLSSSLIPGTRKYNIAKDVCTEFGEEIKKELLEKALNYSDDMKLYNYLSRKYYEDEKIVKFIDTKKEDFIEVDQVAKAAKEIADETLQLTNEFIEKKEQEFVAKAKELEEKYDECYSNIEDSHKAKLNYTVPGKRWQKNSENYMKLFRSCLTWTVSLAIIIALIVIFDFIPMILNLEFSKEENYIKFVAATGAVISVVSLILYNLFKLTFSFYNLAQDATERGELIQTYYALRSEGRATDGNAEEIILKAIFARSDSGLLKSQDTIIPDIFGNKK